MEAFLEQSLGKLQPQKYSCTIKNTFSVASRLLQQIFCTDEQRGSGNKLLLKTSRVPCVKPELTSIYNAF